MIGTRVKSLTSSKLRWMRLPLTNLYLDRTKCPHSRKTGRFFHVHSTLVTHLSCSSERCGSTAQEPSFPAPAQQRPPPVKCVIKTCGSSLGRKVLSNQEARSSPAAEGCVPGEVDCVSFFAVGVDPSGSGGEYFPIPSNPKRSMLPNCQHRDMVK